LLRLPAVADNAAMQTETPNVEPPKRKRRWFQFSLRTLLICVTLLAAVCPLGVRFLKRWRIENVMQEIERRIDAGDHSGLHQRRPVDAMR
jgi:hypothetical protein